ncbi:Ig-like domain-containing protein [Streptomyces asiaticus]|uniref:Ig-like domain-containing protein n=1 Tax=Streptomyces asiaticus TaxID=114695 RepID=UPI0037F82B4E
MPATTATLSFTPLSPECGQTVVLTATVAPTPPDGETVQFIISADGPTLTGTLNGGQATATLSTLSVGSHTAAAYPGDGLFDPSSSAFVPITVNPAATTTTVTSINPASPVCGQTVQLCAHVAASSPSPCLPTGQVTFAVSGGPTLIGNLDANGNVCVSTTGIAPGTHTVTVTYAGNGRVQGSSVNGSITVAKSNSSTLLISSPNSSTFGQNVTFTATVVAVAPGGGVPTGNVTFTISGGPILMGTLNGVGQATASTSALTAGPHTVTATYNGDGCFNPSTSAVLTQQVNPKATTLTAVPATIRMRTNGTFVIPTLSATLTETATSAAVVGQTITFSANSALGPLPLGSAVTDATGTATLTNVAPVGRHLSSPGPDRRPARVQLLCSGVRGDVPARCRGGPSGG